MTTSDLPDLGSYWRSFEIEVRDCTQFYMSFFSYGQQEDQSKWKPLKVSSALATSSQAHLDLQLFDAPDALNGLFPNRILVNFRQTQAQLMSFRLSLGIQGFESGDFVQFRTGEGAELGAITIKAWTQAGLTTVLKSPVDTQIARHILTW